MSFMQEMSRNHLLTNLPTGDWTRWKAVLEPIHLEAGDVTQDIGEAIRYVYFPTTAILSLTHLMKEGGTIEIAMVGSEGMSGISIFMGGGVSTQRVVALRTGSVFRINSTWITSELKASHPLMPHILRFTQSLITQISQIGACSHHHLLEQQLSRWLLSYADRAQSNLVTCTQEHIANLLGVRRERMAKAAIHLQRLGLIQYSRGKIKLLNRAELEQQTCECYATVKSKYDRLSSLTSVL